MAKRSLSAQFKASVVREVVEHSRAIVDVARENGVSTQSVSRWVAAYRAEKSGGDEVGETDAQKVKRLERRVRMLEEEVEILGKATAFFAKKNRP